MPAPDMTGFVALTFGDAYVRDSIITLDGLEDGAARRSTAFDAGSSTYPVPSDFQVYVRLTADGTGPTSSDQVCAVYLQGMPADNMAISTWTDGWDGTDGPTTVTQPTNLIRLGMVHMPECGVTYDAGPFSIASACGGMYPVTMSIIVENRTGNTLSSTAGDNGLVVSSYRHAIVNLDWFMYMATTEGGGGGSA